MRISLAALGSRGDTQPCLALAEGLLKRGHEVTLLASPRYQEVIGRSGVPHVPISFDPQEIVESEAGQAMLNSGPLGFVRGIRTVIEPIAEQVLAELDRACAGTELILAPSMGGIGRHLAQRHSVPHVILQFQPSEPTAAFANPVVSRRSLGPAANRASFALIEALTWAAIGPMINRIRRSVLELGPMRRSSFHRDRVERVPVLCGVSPVVVPRPSDWPGNVHMTGFWLRGAQEELDDELSGFIAAGSAPVFVGFGSMAPADAQRTADQVRVALRRAGVRGVVQGLPAWEPVGGESVHFITGGADHARLFPAMAAVVHHGGAGTTATGLQAGVPSIVCPFFGDQPYWAARVGALGAGPAALPIKELDADRLAARLRQAVGDRALRRRTRTISERLSAEDGVGNACDVLAALPITT